MDMNQDIDVLIREDIAFEINETIALYHDGDITADMMALKISHIINFPRNDKK